MTIYKLYSVFYFYFLAPEGGFIVLYAASIGHPSYPYRNLSFSVSDLSNIGLANTVSNYLIEGKQSDQQILDQKLDKFFGIVQ